MIIFLRTYSRIAYGLLAMAILLVSCNESTPPLPDTMATEESLDFGTYGPILSGEEVGEPMSGEEIYDRAVSMAGSVPAFRWESADDHMLWSAVLEGDSFLVVGYKPESYQLDVIEHAHEIDITEPEWVNARETTEAFIRSEMYRLNPELEQTEGILKTAQVGKAPFLLVKTPDYDVVAKTRRLNTVWAVQPGYHWHNFTPQVEASEVLATLNPLCNASDDDNYLLDPSDDPNNPQKFNNQLFSPNNSVVSWHLLRNGIQDAWCSTRGAGATIAMIDAGIDADQDLLDLPGFTFGPSANRTILKEEVSSVNWLINAIFGTNLNVFPTDPGAVCGHGTTIGGQIAGPVNNDGAITGVAYQANLHSMRLGNDFLIGGVLEEIGFLLASIELTDNSPARVINVSMGHPGFSILTLFGVAYATGNGTLVVGASGSILYNFVTFPGGYPQTLCVSSVRRHPSGFTLLPNEFGIAATTSNAVGPEIDLCVELKHDAFDFWALGMDNDDPDPIAARGTSAGAAVVSGTAGLMWAVNPNLTRAQVRTLLLESGSVFPNQSSFFGTGILGIGEAVRRAESFGNGNLTVSIANGPGQISGPALFCLTPVPGCPLAPTITANVTIPPYVTGPLTYTWEVNDISVNVGNPAQPVTYSTTGNQLTFTSVNSTNRHRLAVSVEVSDGCHRAASNTILVWVN